MISGMEERAGFCATWVCVTGPCPVTVAAPPITAMAMTARAVQGGDSRKASRIKGGKTTNRIGATVWPKPHTVAITTNPIKATTSAVGATASLEKR